MRVIVFIAVLVVGAAACAKKPSTRLHSPTERVGPAQDRRAPLVEPARSTAEAVDAGTTVFFEFDSSELTEGARDALATMAKALSAAPPARIQIEGHCDERGTSEYNIALGERRALAIREHLGRLGVAPARVATISFGAERPLATGTTELAWSQNRRGVVLVKP